MKIVDQIRLWEDNPQKDRTSNVVRVEFKFPVYWWVMDIEELKEILRLWIKTEELRYPPPKYKGRWLLFDKIQEVFKENKTEA